MENDGTWEDGPIPESDSVAICSPCPRERMLLPRARGQPPAPRRVPAAALAAAWHRQLLPTAPAPRTRRKVPEQAGPGPWPANFPLPQRSRWTGLGTLQSTLSPCPTCSDTVLPMAGARAQLAPGLQPSPEHPELRDRRICLSVVTQLRVRSCTSQRWCVTDIPTSLHSPCSCPVPSTGGTRLALTSGKFLLPYHTGWVNNTEQCQRHYSMGTKNRLENPKQAWLWRVAFSQLRRERFF